MGEIVEKGRHFVKTGEIYFFILEGIIEYGLKKLKTQEKDQQKLTRMISLIRRDSMESTMQIALKMSWEGRIYDWIVRSQKIPF